MTKADRNRDRRPIEKSASQLSAKSPANFAPITDTPGRFGGNQRIAYNLLERNNFARHTFGKSRATRQS
jgi:hypothetical protein